MSHGSEQFFPGHSEGHSPTKEAAEQEIASVDAAVGDGARELGVVVTG